MGRPGTSVSDSSSDYLRVLAIVIAFVRRERHHGREARVVEESNMTPPGWESHPSPDSESSLASTLARPFCCSLKADKRHNPAHLVVGDGCLRCRASQPGLLDSGLLNDSPGFATGPEPA